MYSFPLGENEKIIRKDHANMTCDGNHLNGALYLTTDRLVFIGYLLNISNKCMEDVPLEHIESITPEKTFYVIPNAITVRTIQQRKLKFIVKKRDEWIEAIQKSVDSI